MSRLIGSLAALVALIASMYAQVDPVVSVLRAAIAYFVASFAVQIWVALFTSQPTTGTLEESANVGEPDSNPQQAAPS